MLEFLLFCFAVVVLILLMNLKTALTSRLTSLEQRMDVILAELKKARVSGELPALPNKTETIVQPSVTPVITTPPVEKEIIKPEETPKPQEKEPIKTPEVIKHPEVITYSSATTTPTPVAKKPTPAPQPKKPGFFERNPDLEKFIGENLANKIGIGILVLGIGFFVKYAIDQDWINEIGRVFIGILCGGALLGLAHKMRKNFAAFSSVLVGGGIAILYLTIAIAFHEYQIFSQTAAFIIMVFITVLAVMFSIAYNRVELAIVSLLGGFASPFMVSTGEGNYIILFTYVLILDGGMLALAYFKRWNLVNIVAYAFTLLLFGSWLSVKYDYETAGMTAGAFTFASLFYIVFFAMNLMNNIKSRTTFNALEIGLILSNTFLFYAAGMYILNNPDTKIYQGLFTASIGVFNFALSYLLYKKNKIDKKLVFLLIGLVLTFISLAAPVQLEGNYITLFWAAETVLLLWLSQKSGIRLMKLTSVVIMVLMILSLIIDWNQIYVLDYLPLNIIINKGYITGVFAMISIVLTLRFLKNETAEYADYVKPYTYTLTVAGVLILYITNLLELRHQLFLYEFAYEAQNIIIGCYNMLFLTGMLFIGRKLTETTEKAFLSFLGLIGMISFLLYYHEQTISARNFYLLEDGSITGFVFHYPLIILLIMVAWLSLEKVQSLTEFNKETYFAYSWLYVFFFVFMASAELDHTVLLISNANYETIGHTLTQNHKIGYPILWGLTSFLLIFIGLKSKKKQLRIISLTLFLITLVKLFTVDIRGISEGGKIAAFISLGVLLLVVSFMYQRLKKILLADESQGESAKKIEGTID